MGPCVRLIRALVAQPQPELIEEESEKYWGEFKNKAKGESWYLTEQKIESPEVDTDRSVNKSGYCTSTVPKTCITILVSAMNNPTIDDENSLAGKAMLTYEDGSTEIAEVHHIRILSGNGGVETTMLTPVKEIHLIKYCIYKSLSFLCSTNGTSWTTDVGGTRSLGVVRECKTCDL